MQRLLGLLAYCGVVQDVFMFLAITGTSHFLAKWSSHDDVGSIGIFLPFFFCLL